MLTVENAIKLKNDFEYLVGEDYKGRNIEALIITPRNDPEFTKAFELFIRKNNSNYIYPAIESDGYTVTAILSSQDALNKSNIMMHGELFSIISKKEIEIDYSDYGIES